MTKTTNTRPPRFLLQMREDLRHDIERSAIANGRTLTAEINTRLRDSLKHDSDTLREMLNQAVPYLQNGTATVIHTNDNGPANALTDIDRAMLVIFHNLPPEKQLALLSLFR